MKFCIPMPRTVIKTEQVLNKFGPKETSSSQGRVKYEKRPCLAKHHVVRAAWMEGGHRWVTHGGWKWDSAGATRGRAHRSWALCSLQQRFEQSTQSQAGVRCEAMKIDMPPLFSWSYTLE